ncbi:MAG: DNA double-strand break repair nuclease NurA [Thermomicrobiales bacterium]
MSISEENLFSGLPASLLEEALTVTEDVSRLLLEDIEQLSSRRASFREALEAHKLVMRESDLGIPLIPTTCGTDGSYAIERMLTVDLVIAATVAVEGLAPPRETRHWLEPRHSIFVAAEAHSEDTATILRAVMLGRELCLAVEAPHDLVLLDMTLTLPIIYFNQAINAVVNSSAKCATEFSSHVNEYLMAYADILVSARSDHYFAGFPKYSTRREICDLLGWQGPYDDRGLLSLVLGGGELTRPMPITQPDQQWHLSTANLENQASVRTAVGRILDGLSELHVFYYRPQSWLPALRIEVSGAIANNAARLSTVVQGVKAQCATAAMLEPYPLYLADRTVKAAARSLPALRHISSQTLASSYSGSLGDVFLAMHGYRSESGA